MFVKDLPNVDFNTNGDIELAVGRIKEFYKALGWDEVNQELDPTKIKVNKQDYLRLGDTLIKNGKDREERFQLNLVWMNYGPSVDDTVKEGKIKVCNNFVTIS